MAVALAKALGLDYKRVQFTSDMLPADIIGATIFESRTGNFTFHRGPIFTQLLLADEINRTTPKTQSALLEAMAEDQVTVEGETYPLEQPFFVIATQNPLAQYGTFPLPESQLDRFLFRIELGYPTAQAERALLLNNDVNALKNLDAVISMQQLTRYQQQVEAIHASDHLIDYVQQLLAKTRSHDKLDYGISPRGALALMKAAKAWAFLQARDYLIPEDIQAVLPFVFTHRLAHATESQSEAAHIVKQILLSTRL